MIDRVAFQTVLQENEYGVMPAKPISVTAEKTGADEKFCAGKAVLSDYLLTAETEKGTVRFPFRLCVRKGKPRQRAVICLNFRPDVPDKYLPAEEILDRGWAFALLCYRDVTDDSPLIDENAAILAGTGETAPGKLAMWAWAASRVLDALSEMEEIDGNKVGVAGHSRLGKTALLAAAMDQRFAFAHSNDSGSGGAALYAMQNERSESIAHLVKRFPYWFCPKFADYIDRERELPFDQDMLLSLIAPRLLSVGSAAEDLWANPEAERASAERAAAAWGQNGGVSYYCRSGSHYFSREDWNRLFDFLEEKIK